MPPFEGDSGKSAFAFWVRIPVHERHGFSMGLQRLKKLIAATCLRRTKDHLHGQITLSGRTDKERRIDLEPFERELYDFFKSKASALVMSSRTDESINSSSWNNMLSVVNTLRLICDHGYRLLGPSSLQLWHRQAFLRDGLDLDEDITAPQATAEDGYIPDRLMPPINAVEQKGYFQPSSKVKAVIENVLQEQHGNHSRGEEAPIKR